MPTTLQIAEVRSARGSTPHQSADSGSSPEPNNSAVSGTATLSTAPVDGPCDDSCGCATDTTTATTGTTVPLIANADAADTAVHPDGDVSIACTLRAGEVSTRLGEWHALLQGVTARHRIDGGLRLQFRPDADVTQIARLAAAEQSCCRFFDFTLVIDGRGISLDVHAPPDGQRVLTGLFGTAS